MWIFFFLLICSSSSSSDSCGCLLSVSLFLLLCHVPLFSVSFFFLLLQPSLDSMAEGNDGVIGLENEKGRSQVDTINKLLQILMNFSQGKFWPKGGDSFQTKVFQDYLVKHFDMQEFRIFLKENFKDIEGYVDRPL